VDDVTAALGQRDRELGVAAAQLRMEHEARMRSASELIHVRRSLEAVKAELASLGAELQSLTSSRVWSLAQAVWRIRLRIAPPRSRRERYLGLRR
jgi:hypothetical protein